MCNSSLKLLVVIVLLVVVAAVVACRGYRVLHN